jgi:flagellar basal body-associated protein FliL
MKKLLVAFVLLAGVAAVAFASFSNKKKVNTQTEKKSEKKKECKRQCMFS